MKIHFKHVRQQHDVVFAAVAVQHTPNQNIGCRKKYQANQIDMMKLN